MHPWFAILSIVALLAGLGWLAWQRFRRARGLIVGRQGILQPELGDWIPWDEIEGAYTPSAGSESLHVRLRRPEAESEEIRLDLAGSRLTAEELLQEILQHRAPPGES